MGTAFSPPPRASTAANPPPGPDRFTVINVDYTAYTWWVANWSKNQVVCSVIAGVTKPEQVESNAAAAEWALSEDDMAEIDRRLAAAGAR